MNQDLMVFFSRYNLPKTIKNGAYVIILDEYETLASIGLLYYVEKL